MTAQHLTYRPADPLGVVSVDRLQLFTSPDRTGPASVDVGPAIQQPDLSWQFTIPDGTPDGLYYTVTTVTYTDETTQDDADDTIALPLATAAQPGQPIAPWVAASDLPDVAGVTEEQKTEAAQAATELLWALSGRQFCGRRTTTARLLAPSCTCGGQLPGRRLESEQDRWSALYGGCGCARVVMLPDPNVTTVLTVSVDGALLDPTVYRLEANQQLVRLDGDSWPLGNDRNRDRFTVSYVHGQDPPAGGVRAARALATSWLKAEGAGKCGIPSRTTQITAEGVTVLFDDLDAFRKGGTGISEADAWLFSVNPRQLTRRSSVLSPDSIRAVRV